MKLSDLKKAPYNPRRISDKSLDGLKYSLAEFGDISGIVVNTSTGHIVAGHQRIRALSEKYGDLEIVDGAIVTPSGESFKVRFVEWDKAKEKAANVAANSPTISGEFTPDLQALLGEIKLDLPESFDALSLMDIPIPKNGNVDVVEDEAPEPPANPKTVKGDLYEFGRHRLLCGDSTNSDDVARLLGGVSPTLMVTDPPYGVEYDPSWRAKAGVNKSDKKMGTVANDDRVDWSVVWSLFPSVVAYVWHAGRHAAEVQKSLEDAGFDIVCQIIWAKDRFALSRGDYHWQHEPCWYAVRSGKNHMWSAGRDQSTLWSIQRADDAGHGHGTQKPVECMARPIRNNSSEGQAVCDPFMGSGTTIMAAEQLNRCAYGMEIEPKYCDVIVSRWCKFTGKSRVKLNGTEIEWAA